MIMFNGMSNGNNNFNVQLNTIMEYVLSKTLDILYDNEKYRKNYPIREKCYGELLDKRIVSYEDIKNNNHDEIYGKLYDIFVECCIGIVGHFHFNETLIQIVINNISHNNKLFQSERSNSKKLLSRILEIYMNIEKYNINDIIYFFDKNKKQNYFDNNLINKFNNIDINDKKTSINKKENNDNNI